MAFAGGQGVELWYNGLTRFGVGSLGFGKRDKEKKANVEGRKGKAKQSQSQSNSMEESGFIEVESEASESQRSVNGEKVEAEMKRERWVQGVRAVVSGIGFTMGVVGIWGDGAAKAVMPHGVAR